MKITIYTITDCQFSKQEKAYFTSHNLPYEEKNLETNKEFLSEMLTISNNFAGTPVTKIEKEDGQIAVLKGFTKEEFDKTLGFADAKPVEPAPAPQVAAPAPQPATSEPTAQVPAAPAPVKPEPTQTPPTPPLAPQSEAMQSVLNSLQEKAGTPPPPPAP